MGAAYRAAKDSGKVVNREVCTMPHSIYVLEIDNEESNTNTTTYCYSSNYSLSSGRVSRNHRQPRSLVNACDVAQSNRIGIGSHAFKRMLHCHLALSIFFAFTSCKET